MILFKKIGLLLFTYLLLKIPTLWWPLNSQTYNILELKVEAHSCHDCYDLPVVIFPQQKNKSADKYQICRTIL